MKIAMWSGPRNLSTAMMYAFGNRSDLTVWDEPFYAAYLSETGIEHPMREEVLAAGDTNPLFVSRKIAAAKPGLFLKLMSFHMCKGFPLDWAHAFKHIHLIRHPARVVASYSAKRESPTLRDVGFEQQLSIYERFPGVVVESADIRNDPEGMLRKLCASIGMKFDNSMLSWQAGPKPFDGVWAAHWYDAVHRSTGFAGPEDALPVLEGSAADLVEAAMPHYETLRAHALS
ncbi:MAG: HAD family hydrolase [Pseudomonadota bacterium]